MDKQLCLLESLPSGLITNQGHPASHIFVSPIPAAYPAFLPSTFPITLLPTIPAALPTTRISIRARKPLITAPFASPAVTNQSGPVSGVRARVRGPGPYQGSGRVSGVRARIRGQGAYQGSGRV